MAADRMHGVTSREENNGTRPISDISTATIGMVCTGADADAETFPLNKPVLLTSIKSKIGKAGTKGTLYRSLKAILDQTEAKVIVIRVEEGAGEAETTSNIVGDSAGGKYTGIQAFGQAKSMVGEYPTIFGVPDFDTEPVIQALVAMAEKLDGFAYCHVPDLDEVTAVAAFRESFGQRELMLIDDHWQVWDTEANTHVRDMTIARILGLRAKIDQTIGWHKTISNVNVNGVSAIELCRTWGLGDKNTDLNYLNNNEVSGLIRDEGFQVWGNRTTASDKLFVFESYTRTAQIVKKTIDGAFKWAVDKPMSIGLITDIANSAQNKLDIWINQGKLLGAVVWVERADNNTDDVKSGKFVIRRAYTPVPPLEHLEWIQEFTDEFIIEFVDGVITAVGR